METTSTSLGVGPVYVHRRSRLCVVGVLILLYHEFKVIQMKDYKEKYDYVNLNEVRYFWYAVIAFIVAAAIIREHHRHRQNFE